MKHWLLDQHFMWELECSPVVGRGESHQTRLVNLQEGPGDPPLLHLVTKIWDHLTWWNWLFWRVDFMALYPAVILSLIQPHLPLAPSSKSPGISLPSTGNTTPNQFPKLPLPRYFCTLEKLSSRSQFLAPHRLCVLCLCAAIKIINAFIRRIPLLFLHYHYFALGEEESLSLPRW